MNTMPKLLPWLAGKAGISNDKALALWNEIASDASLQSGSAKDPDHYYRLLVDRLHAMDESRQRKGAHSHAPVLVLGSHGSPAAILLNPFAMKTAA